MDNPRLLFHFLSFALSSLPKENTKLILEFNGRFQKRGGGVVSL